MLRIDIKACNDFCVVVSLFTLDALVVDECRLACCMLVWLTFVPVMKVLPTPSSKELSVDGYWSLSNCWRI